MVLISTKLATPKKIDDSKTLLRCHYAVYIMISFILKLITISDPSEWKKNKNWISMIILPDSGLKDKYDSKRNPNKNVTYQIN